MTDAPPGRAGALAVLRVAIATPVRFYREGIADLLARREHLEVVGSCDSGAGLVALVAHQSVDVVLLDLPVPAGPAVARDLTCLDPDLRVVALAPREQQDDVRAWAEAGASGYVSCANTVDEMVAAIESAARGEVACPPRIAGVLLQLVAQSRGRRAGDPEVLPTHRRLTRREREVADLIAEGLSNKQIASSLRITLPTVKNHVSSIFDKLDVTSRHDVLAAAGHERRVRGAVPELPPRY